MSYKTNTDNVYKEGTFITSRENPSRKLIIKRYHQRIYYCDAVDEPGQRQFAYFERELIPPLSV